MTEPYAEQRPQLDYLSPGLGFGGLAPRQVLRPLWFILVGGVLCCITFGVTISSHGQSNWTLHLSIRPVGAILISIGVWQLGRVDIDREYMLLMRFILVVSLFEFAATVADFFQSSGDPMIVLATIFVGLAWIASAIAFCMCMRWFCLDTGLRRSARGWLKTTVVFCFSSVPPVISQCMLLLVVLHITRTRPSAIIQAGWWYGLVMSLIVISPLAFLFNIFQMSREMKRRQLF